MNKTTRILLVDDLRDFKPQVIPEGAELTVCRNSQEAVELLGTTEFSWDQIWLDHDLGLLSDGTDDTTMAVVDYILFRERIGEPLAIEEFIIHSANPVGVSNIARALRSAGIRSQIVDPAEFFLVSTSENPL